MRSLLLLALCTAPTFAADAATKSWDVDGTKREAYVIAPESAKETPSPLVFIFHGHGGTMRHAAFSMPIHKHWPEAVCIYPQGLKTPGQITDPEGKKSGWQVKPGDHGDRDLKFFDAMLKGLKNEYKIDAKRIYCTGHSNGGAFTYQLLATRGDTFAAIAPSAGMAFRLQKDFKPKPVMHIMGEKDQLVSYTAQKRAVDAVIKINGADKVAKPWHDVMYASEYSSKSGTPVVTYIHPGDHTYPADAPPAIVRFFKEYTAK
jgi:polyhydroxybutyrate depolymerase